MDKKEESQYLQVAACQFEPTWLDKSANLKYLEKCITEIQDKPDILVLPEMFTTGFTMDAIEHAELLDGETIEFLIYLAREYQMAIGGSLVIRDKAAYYNRFVFVHPSGEINYYDKKHLFTIAEENNHYTAGHRREIIEYKGWKILPVICYDIRFPVWCRNNLNYDILLCSANWPKSRIEVWNTLLRARAIENQCYVVGVNRLGTDGNKIEHNGQSLMLDSRGEVIREAGDTPTVLNAIFNKYELNEFRKKFPVLKDGDSFQIF